jgi:hypothetical protein
VTLALCLTKGVAIGFIQQVLLWAGIEDALLFWMLGRFESG